MPTGELIAKKKAGGSFFKKEEEGGKEHTKKTGRADENAPASGQARRPTE